MKFFKLLHYDLRVGLLHRKTYGLLMLLVIIIDIDAWVTFRFLGVQGVWMDYVLYLFQGAIPFGGIYTNGEQFDFPVQWLLLMGCCCYLNLSYPFQDLDQFGQQVILRTRSRSQWWTSKSVWCLCAAGYCMGLILGTTLLFCLAIGCPIRLSVTVELLEALFSEVSDLLQYNLDGVQYFAICIGLPLLVLMALNMLQLLIGLLWKPVMGLFCSLSILAVSAIWMSPIAIGNFGMAIRSEWLLYEGVPPAVGCVICLLLIIITGTAGVLWFRRYDILPKEGAGWN